MPAELHVKMLEPNEEDDEATTLKNWVEQGGCGISQPACMICCQHRMLLCRIQHCLSRTACLHRRLPRAQCESSSCARQNHDHVCICFCLLHTGVMDAVSKGYLKNMYFGIAQDAAATNLLEVSLTLACVRLASKTCAAGFPGGHKTTGGHLATGHCGACQDSWAALKCGSH